MATSNTNLDPNQVAKQEIKGAGRKLKIGIIGTGWIADAHMEAYKHMPDVEIVAGADLIPGKAEAFFKKHGVEGVRCYSSDEELIANEKDLDGVSICTYNCQHAPCAIHALNAGINVMLEKPFTVTTEEAVEVMRAEKKSGKVLTIGFQPRFDPNMQMIKKIVESGELGKIYYIQTGGGRRRGIPNSTFIEKSTAGIGAMGDIGCYSLDCVLNAIGYPKPLTVKGTPPTTSAPAPSISPRRTPSALTWTTSRPRSCAWRAASSWTSASLGPCTWTLPATASSWAPRAACASPPPTAGTARSAAP